MIPVIQLQVIGAEKIHCLGCETRIGYALRRLPGVRDVRASAETQQISVTIDPSEVQSWLVEATPWITGALALALVFGIRNHILAMAIQAGILNQHVLLDTGAFAGIAGGLIGLVYPVWTMAAMAGSVTLIFFNSLWGKPSLFFNAVMSVGRPQ